MKAEKKSEALSQVQEGSRITSLLLKTYLNSFQEITSQITCSSTFSSVIKNRRQQPISDLDFKYTNRKVMAFRNKEKEVLQFSAYASSPSSHKENVSGIFIVDNNKCH